MTNDVSTTGLFVVSSTPMRPGTRVHVEILTATTSLFVEGTVARQVIVPPELRPVVRAGFGLRYLSGAELLGELVPAMNPARPDDPFWISFDDEGAWSQAFEKEFIRGGCFVWSSKPIASNTLVKVTVDLRFIGRTMAFDARVVHVMPGEGGRHGVALMFTDAPGTTAALAATLQ